MAEILNAQGEPQNQTIQASGLGKFFKMSGPNAFPWLICFLLLGISGYLAYFALGTWGKPVDIGAMLKLNQAELEERLSKHQATVTYEHKQFVDAIDSLTYVVAKCFGRKDALDCPDVQMPDALRNKVNGRR